MYFGRRNLHIRVKRRELFYFRLILSIYIFRSQSSNPVLRDGRSRRSSLNWVKSAPQQSWERGSTGYSENKVHPAPRPLSHSGISGQRQRLRTRNRKSRLRRRKLRAQASQSRGRPPVRKPEVPWRGAGLRAGSDLSSLLPVGARAGEMLGAAEWREPEDG